MTDFLTNHSIIMKKYLFFLAGLILAATAHTQNYQLNPDKSEMAWAGKAAFSTYTLSGGIKPRTGKLIVEGERIRDASLVIDMQSIRSDIAQLEKHLRSADFFKVEGFPEAVFLLGQPIVLGGGEQAAVGVLKIKGVSNQEEIPITARMEEATLVLEGKAVIDRTAYGIYYNSPNFFEGLKQDAIADAFELSFRLVFEGREAE